MTELVSPFQDLQYFDSFPRDPERSQRHVERAPFAEDVTSRLSVSRYSVEHHAIAQDSPRSFAGALEQLATRGPRLCPQPEGAAARTAGGARTARGRTKYCAVVSQRPSSSEPRNGSFCGPPPASSGHVQNLRRSATFNAAPSTSTVQGCGWPVHVRGDTGQCCVARQRSWPRKRRSKRRRSSAGTPAAVVWVSVTI